MWLPCLTLGSAVSWASAPFSGEERGRIYCCPPRSGRMSRLRNAVLLPVFLSCLPNRTTARSQILRVHDWPQGDRCVEREKPRLGDRWNLRRVLHIEHDSTAPPAFIIRKEIGCFGLEFGKNFLDRSAKCSSLSGGIAGFRGNRCSQQHSHGIFPPLSKLAPESCLNGLRAWIVRSLCTPHKLFVPAMAVWTCSRLTGHLVPGEKQVSGLVAGYWSWLGCQGDRFGGTYRVMRARPFEMGSKGGLCCFLRWPCEASQGTSERQTARARLLTLRRPAAGS